MLSVPTTSDQHTDKLLGDLSILGPKNDESLGEELSQMNLTQTLLTCPICC